MLREHPLMMSDIFWVFFDRKTLFAKVPIQWLILGFNILWVKEASDKWLKFGPWKTTQPTMREVLRVVDLMLRLRRLHTIPSITDGVHRNENFVEIIPVFSTFSNFFKKKKNYKSHFM